MSQILSLVGKTAICGESNQVGPRQSDGQMYHHQVELHWVCKCFHLLRLFYTMDSDVLVQIGRQYIMEACLHMLESI